MLTPHLRGLVYPPVAFSFLLHAENRADRSVLDRLQPAQGLLRFRGNRESEGGSHALGTWRTLGSSARTQFRTNPPPPRLQRGPSAGKSLRDRGRPATPRLPPKPRAVPAARTPLPAPRLRGGPRSAPARIFHGAPDPSTLAFLSGERDPAGPHSPT